MTNHHRVLRLGHAVLAFAISATFAGPLFVGSGCAASPEREFGGPSAENSESGDGGSGGGEATSVASAGSGGLDVEGGTGGVQGCVAEEVEAEPIPLDIIVLVDSSESMAGALWNGMTDALKTFVTDPASAGIAVGLGTFPVPGSGPAVCDESNYQSLLVPIGPLPQSAATLVGAIDAAVPGGGTTPLPSALEGGLAIAMAQQAAHPSHEVILVLATDGKTTCVTNTNTLPLAATAADALASAGVETYTIALFGADIAELNDIALAGGTGATYDVTADITAFAQKMEEIRASAMPCEVVIPPPPTGEELDPDLVNVKYTPGGSMQGQNIPFVGTAAGCGSQPGWYYDDPSMPTRVAFCPATCSEVKSDLGAKIDVAFGCKTIAK